MIKRETEILQAESDGISVSASEIDLRQRLTALKVLIAASAVSPKEMTRGSIMLALEATLCGCLDPRDHIRGVVTVAPGHVGSDGVLIPAKANFPHLSHVKALD